MKRIAVPLTRPIHAELKETADLEGLKIASYVRRLIHNDLRARRTFPGAYQVTGRSDA